VKRFIYEGLGFPVVLVDVPFIEVKGIWTPAINYNDLQKNVLRELYHKPFLFPVTRCILSELILR
jgi:hypothetical protein